jgi:hypothetical protein
MQTESYSREGCSTEFAFSFYARSTACEAKIAKLVVLAISDWSFGQVLRDVVQNLCRKIEEARHVIE